MMRVYEIAELEMVFVDHDEEHITMYTGWRREHRAIPREVFNDVLDAWADHESWVEVEQ